MIDRHSIPYQHWSLKVGRARFAEGGQPIVELDDYLGEIVFAVDDLDQSIANIVLTPKGSVPTEPEKGCDLYPFIDRHPDIAIPNLTRVIWDALLVWEPRIVVKEVSVDQVAYSHFRTQVFWRPVESVLDDLRVTEVTFGNAGSGGTADGGRLAA